MEYYNIYIHRWQPCHESHTWAVRARSRVPVRNQRRPLRAHYVDTITSRTINLHWGTHPPQALRSRHFPQIYAAVMDDERSNKAQRAAQLRSDMLVAWWRALVRERGRILTKLELFNCRKYFSFELKCCETFNWNNPYTYTHAYMQKCHCNVRARKAFGCVSQLVLFV